FGGPGGGARVEAREERLLVWIELARILLILLIQLIDVVGVGAVDDVESWHGESQSLSNRIVAAHPASLNCFKQFRRWRRARADMITSNKQGDLDEEQRV